MCRVQAKTSPEIELLLLEEYYAWLNTVHPECDTPKGAEASAIVYSMVESAKANGIELFAYLQHVLLELPYLGK